MRRGLTTLAVAFSLAIAGCSSNGEPLARVSGTLAQVGGPYGNPPGHPNGTITFVDAAGVPFTTPAVAGAFSIRLRPGTYTVTGAAVTFGDGKGGCVAEDPVKVGRIDVSGVQVICPMR